MGTEVDYPTGDKEGVILGVDGGTTSTTCVCLPLLPLVEHRQFPDPIPVLGRAAAGCSNHNSVGEIAAKAALAQVIAEALSEASKNHSAVRAVFLGVSGVSRPVDQERILNWMRDIFPANVKIYVRNDAVAALASGTMGKLHGCVLIAGTGCIAYGFTEDGTEAHAAGGGPVLGDWGSGYGIASRALTAVFRAHDGRGPETKLTKYLLEHLNLTSPDELISWIYEDSSWARIAALVPQVVSSAEAGDQVSDEILKDAVHELALSVQAVVRRLSLAGEDGNAAFPVVLVGGVLDGNRDRKWDIAKEVTDSILQVYPGACPIKPKVEPAIGAALFALNTLMKETELHGCK